MAAPWRRGSTNGGNRSGWGRAASARRWWRRSGTRAPTATWWWMESRSNRQISLGLVFFPAPDIVILPRVANGAPAGTRTTGRITRLGAVARPQLGIFMDFEA